MYRKLKKYQGQVGTSETNGGNMPTTDEIFAQFLRENPSASDNRAAENHYNSDLSFPTGDGRNNIIDKSYQEAMKLGDVAMYPWLGAHAASSVTNPTVNLTSKIAGKKLMSEGSKQALKQGLKTAGKFIGSKVFFPLEVADLAYNVGKGTPENYWLFGGGKWLLENMLKGAYSEDTSNPTYSVGPDNIHGVGTPKFQYGDEVVDLVTPQKNPNIQNIYEGDDRFTISKMQKKQNKTNKLFDEQQSYLYGDDGFINPDLNLNENPLKKEKYTLYNPTDEEMFYDPMNPTKLFNEEDYNTYQNDQTSTRTMSALNARDPNLFQRVTGFDPETQEISYAGKKLKGDLFSDANPDSDYLQYTTPEGEDSGSFTGSLRSDAEGDITGPVYDPYNKYENDESKYTFTGANVKYGGNLPEAQSGKFGLFNKGAQYVNMLKKFITGNTDDVVDIEQYVKKFSERTTPVRGGKVFDDGINEYNSLQSMYNINPNRVVKPLGTVTDKAGNFTGYSMENLKNFQDLNPNTLTNSMKNNIINTIQDFNSKGIYHGDLKLNNIMADQLGNFKIIDPVGFQHGTKMTKEMLKEAKSLDLNFLQSLMTKAHGGPHTEDEWEEFRNNKRSNHNEYISDDGFSNQFNTPETIAPGSYDPEILNNVYNADALTERIDEDPYDEFEFTDPNKPNIVDDEKRKPKDFNFKPFETLVTGLSAVNSILENRPKDFSANQLAHNQFTADTRNNRGQYDVNTGILNPDNNIITRQGQGGVEIDELRNRQYDDADTTIDLDEATIQELIAAGAEIEIL